MAFLEVTVGGTPQLLNVDAIQQISPGPNGESSIHLRGGERAIVVQAQQSVEQVRKALLTVGRQTVVASAY